MTSIHELAIQRVMRRREGIRINGMGKFLRSMSESRDGTIIDHYDITTRRPDAWAYEPAVGSGTLYLFEIEDQNPISTDKLRDYADFWFACDTYDIDLKLFVYDRYGEQEREINLCEYLLMFWEDDMRQGKFSA